jgi:hypothetical protein
MTDVFISWSGTASQKSAEALSRWLPVWLPEVHPFVSSQNLEKGSRWERDLSKELSKNAFGILCSTPENLVAPWILFEAGALSKALEDSYVSPLLMRVRPSDLQRPLSQFNATQLERAEIFKLIQTINNLAGDRKRPTDVLELAFESGWPKLEAELNEADKLLDQKSMQDRDHIQENNDPGRLERLDRVLEEVLVNTRQISHSISSEGPFSSISLEKIMTEIKILGQNSKALISIEREHAVWSDLILGWKVLSGQLETMGYIAALQGAPLPAGVYETPLNIVNRAMKYIAKFAGGGALETRFYRRQTYRDLKQNRHNLTEKLAELGAEVAASVGVR